MLVDGLSGGNLTAPEPLDCGEGLGVPAVEPSLGWTLCHIGCSSTVQNKSWSIFMEQGMLGCWRALPCSQSIEAVYKHSLKCLYPNELACQLH